MKDFALGFLITYALLMIVGLALVGATLFRQVPQCAEDAVLIGTGDFDHGRYESYVCGPSVDDYVR